MAREHLLKLLPTAGESKIAKTSVEQVAKHEGPLHRPTHSKSRIAGDADNLGTFTWANLSKEGKALYKNDMEIANQMLASGDPEQIAIAEEIYSQISSMAKTNNQWIDRATKGRDPHLGERRAGEFRAAGFTETANKLPTGVIPTRTQIEVSPVSQYIKTQKQLDPLIQEYIDNPEKARAAIGMTGPGASDLFRSADEKIKRGMQNEGIDTRFIRDPAPTLKDVSLGGTKKNVGSIRQLPVPKKNVAPTFNVVATRSPVVPPKTARTPDRWVAEEIRDASNLPHPVLQAWHDILNDKSTHMDRTEAWKILDAAIKEDPSILVRIHEMSPKDKPGIWKLERDGSAPYGAITTIEGPRGEPKNIFDMDTIPGTNVIYQNLFAKSKKGKGKSPVAKTAVHEAGHLGDNLAQQKDIVKDRGIDDYVPRSEAERYMMELMGGFTPTSPWYDEMIRKAYNIKLPVRDINAHWSE